MLNRIKLAILQETNTTPLEIAAACAHIALSQAVTLGTLINRGKLNAKDVPTDTPSKVMAMLSDDPGALSMFQYIAGILMGLANALPKDKGLVPYDSVVGMFKFNVGMVEDAQLNKIAKLIHKGDFSLSHLNDGVVNKITQSAAWFYIFMIYHNAAVRLNVEDAQLDHFSQVPANVANCLRAVMNSLATAPSN